MAKRFFDLSPQWASARSRIRTRLSGLHPGWLLMLVVLVGAGLLLPHALCQGWLPVPLIWIPVTHVVLAGLLLALHLLVRRSRRSWQAGQVWVATGAALAAGAFLGWALTGVARATISSVWGWLLVMLLLGGLSLLGLLATADSGAPSGLSAALAGWPWSSTPTRGTLIRPTTPSQHRSPVWPWRTMAAGLVLVAGVIAGGAAVVVGRGVRSAVASWWHLGAWGLGARWEQATYPQIGVGYPNGSARTVALVCLLVLAVVWLLWAQVLTSVCCLQISCLCASLMVLGLPWQIEWPVWVVVLTALLGALALLGMGLWMLQHRWSPTLTQQHRPGRLLVAVGLILLVLAVMASWVSLWLGAMVSAAVVVGVLCLAALWRCSGRSGSGQLSGS